MEIFGRSKTFEEGIKGFKENLLVISKLLGDKTEFNETAIITQLLQKVFEERKLYQSGKEPRQCEIYVKPNEVQYSFLGYTFGWTIFPDGNYEFYLISQ